MTTEEVREKILHTAYRLFYTNGYRATGVNQIIEEANIAKATLYHHFKSKEDLAIAYLELRGRIFFRSIVNEIDRLAKRPIDKVIAMYQAYENIYLGIAELEESRIPEDLRVGFHGCHYIKIDMEAPSEKIKQAVREHQDRVLKSVQYALDAAIEAGELKSEADTKQLALQLLMLADGAVIQTNWGADARCFVEAANVAKGILREWSLVEV